MDAWNYIFNTITLIVLILNFSYDRSRIKKAVNYHLRKIWKCCVVGGGLCRKRILSWLGCGDRRANEEEQTFYDIFLVSSYKSAHHVDEIKDMCKRNGWTFTTLYDAEVSIKLAPLTCSYVVVLITKDDCSSLYMYHGQYNSTPIDVVFSLESGKIGSRVLPIRSCDRDSLPEQLKCLVGSTIDDYDLEERMRYKIDKKIRRNREAQHAVLLSVKVHQV